MYQFASQSDQSRSEFYATQVQAALADQQQRKHRGLSLTGKARSCDVGRSPRIRALRALQQSIDRSPRVAVPQLTGVITGPQPREVAAIQRYAAVEGNKISDSRDIILYGSNLPEKLRAGIEHLSEISMEPVRVHRNSPRPAQIQSLAFTQGTDIYLAPGQERHLPHEAWHVVQQLQGRVRPTVHRDGVAINDDARLEAEADRMGRAAQLASPYRWKSLGCDPDRGVSNESFFASIQTMKLVPTNDDIDTLADLNQRLQQCGVSNPITSNDFPAGPSTAQLDAAIAASDEQIYQGINRNDVTAAISTSLASLAAPAAPAAVQWQSTQQDASGICEKDDKNNQKKRSALNKSIDDFVENMVEWLDKRGEFAADTATDVGKQTTPNGCSEDTASLDFQGIRESNGVFWIDLQAQAGKKGQDRFTFGQVMIQANGTAPDRDTILQAMKHSLKNKNRVLVHEANLDAQYFPASR